MLGIEHETQRSMTSCLRTTPARRSTSSGSGKLIDLISNMTVGDAAARSRDVRGRVYEYFLPQFASAEGKKGGECYTPRCVVTLLVEMLEQTLRRFMQEIGMPVTGHNGTILARDVENVAAATFYLGGWSDDEEHYPVCSSSTRVHRTSIGVLGFLRVCMVGRCRSPC